MTLNPDESSAAEGATVPVSVIVPAGGAKNKDIERCLECLAGQDFEEDYEVVLGVTGNVKLMGGLGAKYPFVHLGSCTPGSGPGGARNEALALARGEILLFTDVDCRPARNWIRTMVHTIRSRCGLPVRGWIQTGRSWGVFQRASDYAECGTGKPRKPVLMPGWFGGNMGCGRKWYDAGARFAESVYGGEEVFFLSRFGEDARKVLLHPGSVVIHDNPLDFSRAYKRMFRLGSGSGACRRHIAIRGSFFARHPWLSLLLVPARAVFAIWRLRRCTLCSIIEFGMLFPVIILFWTAYARGFAHGVRESSLEDGI